MTLSAPTQRFTAPTAPKNVPVKMMAPRFMCKEFVPVVVEEGSGQSAITISSSSPSPVPRGGELPRVKRFSIDTINANPRNEDRSIVDLAYEDVHLFAVLDGHGGPTCSIFCEKTVPIIFKSVRNESTAPFPYEEILKETLQKLDEAYIKEFGRDYKSCGSCAIVCLLTCDKVITGCVGDCRAVMARRSEDTNKIEPHPLSEDQDCSNRKECDIVRKRTTDQTPIRVCANGTRRVAGTLMVTRALGDVYLKQPEFSFPPYRLHVPYITSDPVITVHPLTSRDHAIVMASDGLYNLLDNQKVVDLAMGGKASVLIDAAVNRAASVMGMTVRMVRQMPSGRDKRQVHDDITVLIIELGENAVVDVNAAPLISEASLKEREAVSPTPQEPSFGREASVVLLTEPPPVPSPLLPPEDDVVSNASSQPSTTPKQTSKGFSSFLRSVKKRSAKPSPPPRRGGGGGDSAPGTPLTPSPSPASTPGSQSSKRPASAFPSTPTSAGQPKKPRSLLNFKNPPKKPCTPPPLPPPSKK